MCQSEFSVTMRTRGLLTQTSKEWEFTPPYGMLITGPPEAGLWKSIGPVHPSSLDSVILGPELVNGLGQPALANVHSIPLQTGGLHLFIASWAIRSMVRCSGSEITTWFMIIAKIPRGSTDRCPLNVSNSSSDMTKAVKLYIRNFSVVLTKIAAHFIFFISR